MRLQTAIEYLTTYGWAITILGVVLLLLFATGFFNPSNYEAQECVMTSSFSCLSFFMAGNGILTLNLQQSTNSAINITALGCTQNGTAYNMQKPFNPPSNQIFLSIGGNYTFSVQCYTGLTPVSSLTSTVFSGAIIINYTNEITNLPGKASGKLIVKPAGIRKAP